MSRVLSHSIGTDSDADINIVVSAFILRVLVEDSIPVSVPIPILQI